MRSRARTFSSPIRSGTLIEACRKSFAKMSSTRLTEQNPIPTRDLVADSIQNQDPPIRCGSIWFRFGFELIAVGHAQTRRIRVRHRPLPIIPWAPDSCVQCESRHGATPLNPRLPPRSRDEINEVQEKSSFRDLIHPFVLFE
mmetsp:Transcript_18971/g.52697  ORF Transcript_18971/g.52697 Transcript_18971/m.52697 type:complete len:142 (+) Transcript_18971:1613-2038(+)